MGNRGSQVAVTGHGYGLRLRVTVTIIVTPQPRSKAAALTSPDISSFGAQLLLFMYAASPDVGAPVCYVSLYLLLTQFSVVAVSPGVDQTSVGDGHRLGIPGTAAYVHHTLTWGQRSGQVTESLLSSAADVPDVHHTLACGSQRLSGHRSHSHPLAREQTSSDQDRKQPYHTAHHTQPSEHHTLTPPPDER